MTRRVCDYCGGGYDVRWVRMEARDICAECRFNLALLYPAPAPQEPRP